MIEEGIQKTGRGRVWVGVGGRIGRIDHFFGANPKTPKNSTKCLIFNGSVFWSGFGVVLEWF